MPETPARSEEEYNLLQKQILVKINKTNAKKLAVQAKTSIIEKLNIIDVHSIRDIEDLYLIGLEFIIASRYLLALSNSQQKATTLEAELLAQGPDKLLPFLISQFTANMSQYLFSKIIEIEHLHRPGLEEWAQVHLNFLALTQGLYEEPKVIHLTHLIAKESARLRKGASFFERLKVNQFIEQAEKITQAYLIDKNENKFFNGMMKQITKTRDLFNERPSWQRLFDALANALIKLFKQSQAYNDFSFFSNQATQETIDKLEIAIKPK